MANEHIEETGIIRTIHSLCILLTLHVIRSQAEVVEVYPVCLRRMNEVKEGIEKSGIMEKGEIHDKNTEE